MPITYGFGMRSGRMHEGADFVPGQGAEIQAIAEGTVRIATSSEAYTGMRMLNSPYHPYQMSPYCSGVTMKNDQKSAR